MSAVKRRRFLFATSALLAPFAMAQPASPVRRVGAIAPWAEIDVSEWSSSPAAWNSPLAKAFLQRMRDLGWMDGQNVVFKGRRGPQERLPELAADLLDTGVEVVVAWSSPAVAALKRHTNSVPIVMAGVGNAEQIGFVASLARPGGNVTGVTSLDREVFQKQAELIREVVPGATRIGILWDSTIPVAANVRAAMDEIAKVLQMRFEIVEAATASEFDKTFAALRRSGVDGVIVHAVPRYGDARVARAALAHRLATVFGDAFLVSAGGLMAYNANWVEISRMAANYVDRILKGAKPADLPVEQPTRFELTINLATAKALGIKVPQSVLLRADRVIE